MWTGNPFHEISNHFSTKSQTNVRAVMDINSNWNQEGKGNKPNRKRKRNWQFNSFADKSKFVGKQNRKCEAQTQTATYCVGIELQDESKKALTCFLRLHFFFYSKCLFDSRMNVREIKFICRAVAGHTQDSVCGSICALNAHNARG